MLVLRVRAIEAVGACAELPLRTRAQDLSAGQNLRALPCGVGKALNGGLGRGTMTGGNSPRLRYCDTRRRLWEMRA